MPKLEVTLDWKLGTTFSPYSLRVHQKDQDEFSGTKDDYNMWMCPRHQEAKYHLCNIQPKS